MSKANYSVLTEDDWIAGRPYRVKRFAEKIVRLLTEAIEEDGCFSSKGMQNVRTPDATVTGLFLDANNQVRYCIDKELPLMTELFTNLSCISEREPMTDAEINKLFQSIKHELCAVPGGSENVHLYRRVIVRAIEAHHGITPGAIK